MLSQEFLSSMTEVRSAGKQNYDYTFFLPQIENMHDPIGAPAEISTLSGGRRYIRRCCARPHGGIGRRSNLS